MYIYICVYTHTHVHIYIYAYAYICTYLSIYLYLFIYLFIYINLSHSIYLSIYLSICIYISICLYIYIHIYVPIRATGRGGADGGALFLWTTMNPRLEVVMSGRERPPESSRAMPSALCRTAAPVVACTHARFRLNLDVFQRSRSTYSLATLKKAVKSSKPGRAQQRFRPGLLVSTGFAHRAILNRGSSRRA